jgi:hypothetical protein
MRPWCRETPPRLEQAPSAWLTCRGRKQQHSANVSQWIRPGRRALGVGPWCRETPPRLEQAPSAWLTYKRRQQQQQQQQGTQSRSEQITAICVLLNTATAYSVLAAGTVYSMRHWCRETPPRLEQAPSAWLIYKRKQERKQQHTTSLSQAT